MSEQTQNYDKIDIYRLLRLTLRQAKRLWIIVILLMVALGGVQGLRAFRDYTPQYQATATYAASSGIGGVTDIATNTSYYDTQTRAQIVSSFPYIMGSEAMVERVKEELGMSYIPGSVTASSVGDTSFYKITATGSEPEMTRKLLEAVVKHYPEAASFVIGNALIEEVEAPRVGAAPINQFSVRNSIIKGAVLGLMLGMLILLILALNHRTVESSLDLRREIQLPCLGTIPLIETKKRRNSGNNQVSLLNPNVESALETGIGDLRVKLLRRERKTKPDGKVLLVTSTYAGEGKTTVSVNLAISLAKSGKRVILVDTDLRNQTVKSCFGLKTPTKGLLDLVEEGETNPDGCLVQIERLPLYILAGDRQMESPLKQLESGRMQTIIDQLKDMADVVILDAPPTGLLVDASILGAQADFSLYVVRYDGASVHQVVDSIQELQRQKVTLLGYVINGSKAAGRNGYGLGTGRA